MSELSENSMDSNWQPCLLTALVRPACKVLERVSSQNRSKNRSFLVVSEAYRNDFSSEKKFRNQQNFSQQTPRESYADVSL